MSNYIAPWCGTHIHRNFELLPKRTKKVHDPYSDSSVDKAFLPLIRQMGVSRAVAGEHLTDQLLLYLALARGGSFTATKLSRHARTNQEIITKFLAVEFETEHAGDHFVVRLKSQYC